MLVNLTLTQLKIINAVGKLTKKRKLNKNVIVNANSIRLEIGMDWHTIDSNLLKLENIKGI